MTAAAINADHRAAKSPAAMPTASPVSAAQANASAATPPAAARTVAAPPAGASAAAAPSAAQVWAWLAEVSDPEIPVISIVDLGIVRDVRLAADGACDVTITPTYSGCPAMQVIADAITDALHAHGLQKVRLHNQLSPAWTTDWMSEDGKAKLKGYGIAPPAQQVIDISGLRTGRGAPRGADNPSGAHADAALNAISRRPRPRLTVACPNCGSTHTETTSQFGSTPCKALYKCLDCREPFDYFKCH